MLNRTFFSLLQGSLLIALGGLLTACASNSSPKSDGKPNSGSISSSACVGNAYLQKYGCSFQRIQQAAKNGDPDAQYALGYMYYYGVGTVRDRETAKLWIDRASDQGQPLARKAQELIASGEDFHHLHRQKNTMLKDYNAPSDNSSNAAATTTTNENSGSEATTASPKGKIKYAPTPDVDTLNNTTPTKSLNEVLPNYNGEKDQSKPVIKSLQKDSDSATPPSDEENPGVTEPITQNDQEKKILAVSDKRYTIQLMSGHDLAGIQAFVKKNHLENKTHYYSTQLYNESWYTLVYGNYSNSVKAHTAIKKLSTSLADLHPWVKSYRVVQDEIRSRHIVT